MSAVLKRRLPGIAGLVLLGVFWGAATALAGLNALLFALSLVGCAFILRDFRFGVVLLIMLMPVSSSTVFPHAMLGVTGLNPLNLLMMGTLGSCLLHGLFDGSIRRFVPPALFWLYVLPFVIAGVLGSRHVGEIPAVFFMYEGLEFHDAAGYLRDFVLKPLFFVIFALLIAAAVAKSDRPEKFLIPAWISIWVMGAMVIGFVAQSGIALGQLASSTEREFLSPLGLHANDLGRLYAVAYALLLFAWAEAKEPGHRLLLLASMGLVVVALVLTFSRAAFLGFLLVNVLFLLSRRNLRTLALFGLLAVVALLVLPEAVYERVETGFGRGLDAISAGRIEGLWLPLLPDVLRHPVIGSGIGSILWSAPMRAGAGVTMLGVSQAHNAYLDAVLDMGVAGLLLVGAYFVHVWRGFRALGVAAALPPVMRGFFLGAAAGLASFAAAGVAGSRLTPMPEQVFLWLAIGMMYGYRARMAVNAGASPAYAEAGSARSA